MKRDIYELARIISNLDDQGIDCLIEELKVNFNNSYWYMINQFITEEE